MEASTLLSQDYIRSQRLARDQSALDELEAQAMDAETAVTSIRAQIVALETSLRAALAWQVDVVPRRDALRASVAAQRSALSPISTLSSDVLALVFQQAVWAPDSGKWNSIHERSLYDSALASAPYTLAGVCSHWRTTAISTPSLWSYIAVPKDLRHLKPSFGLHISLLLQRSKAAPLDVLVESIDSSSSDVFNRIFATICEHIGRWRRFYACVATQVSYPPLTGYLRASMPRLQELYIQQDVHDLQAPLHWPEELPMYLRDTQRLQKLCIRSLPVALNDMPTTIDTLTELYLGSNFMPYAALSATLRRTPRLQNLSLWATTNDGGDGENPIHLNHLQGLVLWHKAPSLLARYPTLLVMPQLTYLNLRLWGSNETQLRDLQAFFSACPQSLVRMQLTARALSPDDIATLRTLRHIVKFELSSMEIPATFFDFLRVAEAGQCLWPKLKRLSLRNVRIEPEDSDSIVRAARARRTSPSTSSDAPWERLEAMTIDDASTVPGWHRAEIKSILT